MTGLVTARLRGERFIVDSATSKDVKDQLASIPGFTLRASEMKLIKGGKVLSDEALVPGGSNVMVMRCPAPVDVAKVRVLIREIVTGRTAVDTMLACSTSYDELMSIATEAMELPAGKELCTRLFVSQTQTLMRTDLSIANYALGADKIECFVVPCPPHLHPNYLASVMQEELESGEAEEAEHPLEEGALAYEEPEELFEISVEISEDSDVHDFRSLAVLLSADLQLPSSMNDEDGELGASEEKGSQGSTSDGIRQVPTMRTGLMAAPSVPRRRRVIPQDLLDELEEYEAAAANPLAAREQYVEAETVRLERRYAMLVQSLDEPRAARQSRGHRRLHETDWAERLPRRFFCDDRETWKTPREHGSSEGEMSGGGTMSGSTKFAKQKSPLLTCQTCAVRLPITALTSSCKCGGCFCAEHMHRHECSFDHRAAEQRKLKDANPKVEASKFEHL